MDDDAIAQIVMVTNTTTEKATQYLTLADGDADQAVTLFFENGGADLVGASTASTITSHATPTSRITGTGDPSNPISIDDDDIFDDDNPQVTRSQPAEASESRDRSAQPTSSTFDDDAALARQLQEEMYGGGAAGTSDMNGEEQPIRAPIARQAETLAGPGADMGAYSDAELPAAIQERMQEFHRRRQGGASGKSVPRGLFTVRSLNSKFSSSWDLQPATGHLFGVEQR